MKTTKRIAALLLALALMLGLSSCYYTREEYEEAYYEGYDDGYYSGYEAGYDDAIWGEWREH